MCEHHHAAKHILCSQCDMLVALPRLEHGQKAACPRCGTTLTVAWDAPRQRPTAYALAALFMLLLSVAVQLVHAVAVQLVSFCEYERCRSYQ